MEEQLQFNFEDIEDTKEVEEELNTEDIEVASVKSILDALQEPDDKQETGTIIVELDGTVRIEKD